MTTAQVLKSIADDTRLAIIRKLADEPGAVACQDIVQDCSLALKLSQPTMSHHFTKLVQANVIIAEKIGKEKYYSLNHELFASIGINPHKL